MFLDVFHEFLTPFFVWIEVLFFAILLCPTGMSNIENDLHDIVQQVLAELMKVKGLGKDTVVLVDVIHILVSQRILLDRLRLHELDVTGHR